MHADRRAHEVVVEEVRELAGRRHPAHVLDLARARLPAFLVRLGRVVVVAGIGRPLRVGLRVERPVRQVDALHRVGQRALLERIRREPQLAVPLPDAIARRALAHHERQHALGAERGLGFLVRHELRRAAELAVLRLPLRIEHRDRVAALAAHLALVGLPAARVVGEAAQRGGEVVLGDRAGEFVELGRRLGAAERADQLLLGGIPVGFAAARRARELPDRGRFAHARPWRQRIE